MVFKMVRTIVIFEEETRWLIAFCDGGAEGIRTPDPHNAIVVLYQLSYDPITGLKP
jgi:hypothetical protein